MNNFMKSINNILDFFSLSPQKRGGDSVKSKQVTGYILYSSDIRKTVTQNNPNSTFGEVSRIVGGEVSKNIHLNAIYRIRTSKGLVIPLPLQKGRMQCSNVLLVSRKHRVPKVEESFHLYISVARLLELTENVKIEMVLDGRGLFC